MPSVTSVPECLERSNCGTLVKFNTNTRTQFLAWFHTTQWYLNRHNSPTYSLPGFSNHLKTATAWNKFDEVAHKDTGRCNVICRNCQSVIEHPNHYNAGGTSGMLSHIRTANCRKHSRYFGERTQLSLQNSLQTGNVSLLPYLYSSCFTCIKRLRMLLATTITTI